MARIDTLPDVLAHGMQDGVVWCLREAPGLGSVNGYACLPKGHPWHGLTCDELDDLVDIHGGVTFAEDGWIGFDTAHAFDHWPGSALADMMHASSSKVQITWTMDKVEAEARHLAAQVAAAGRGKRP